MNRIFEILKRIVLSLIPFAILFLLLGFISNWMWNSNSVNTYSEALSLIDKYGRAEYKIMMTECEKLLEVEEDRFFSEKSIPQNLKPFSPQYVRSSKYNCEISLYKVPGKGIGYFVSKDVNGKLNISWHNHFQGWQNNEIDY